MINAVNLAEQSISETGTLIFTSSPVRTKSCRCGGWLYHDDGSGIFTITQGGIYEVSYNANVSNGGANTVALGIRNNGEVLGGSVSSTGAVMSTYGVGLSASRLVRVPCNASANITIGGVVVDPMAPTYTMTVTDANVIIKRLA